MPNSTMLINSETRRLLRSRARKEQTYDDFIKELIATYDRCMGKTKIGQSVGQDAPTTTEPITSFANLGLSTERPF